MSHIKIQKHVWRNKNESQTWAWNNMSLFALDRIYICVFSTFSFLHRFSSWIDPIIYVVEKKTHCFCIFVDDFFIFKFEWKCYDSYLWNFYSFKIFPATIIALTMEKVIVTSYIKEFLLTKKLNTNDLKFWIL